ncbi:hypothetical protein BH10PSE9_BH10PSE9_16130 [soil metagenome]
MLVAAVMLPGTASAQNRPLPLPSAKAAPAKAATPIAAPAASAKAATGKAAAPPPPAAGSGDDFGGDADSGDEIIDEGSSGDGLDVGDLPVGPETPAVPDVGPPKDIRAGTFTLEARLTADGAALKDGARWRIFGDKPGNDGRLPLLGQASGGIIYVRLDPGIYFVHVAYGRAGTTRKVEVKSATGGQVFVINAGGMRLFAINGKDVPLPNGDVSFDVYAPDEGGAEERSLIIPNAPAGKVLGLNAGTYRIVCRYGDANAVVRADIRVDPGKLTEATVYQKAARLTLKLVEQHGGEALANTAWSVITPTGETVVASVGAFPSVILAAGSYRAVAKHDGKTFESTFRVDAAVNRDVEVIVR